MLSRKPEIVCPINKGKFILKPFEGSKGILIESILFEGFFDTIDINKFFSLQDALKEPMRIILQSNGHKHIVAEIKTTADLMHMALDNQSPEIIKHFNGTHFKIEISPHYPILLQTEWNDYFSMEVPEIISEGIEYFELKMWVRHLKGETE